jgi:mRNA interferase RelE/StbE
LTREVLLSGPAERDLGRLPTDQRSRVRKGLLHFATTGRGDLKRLRGVNRGPDLFRLRIGNYRVVFELTAAQVRVTRIFHRGEGYDWL